MLVLIQARSSSARFKNKVLHSIYGEPLIWHVINKINKSKNKIKLIVATSKHESDDKLVRYLKLQNIDFYRGSLNNVALRLYNAAKKFKSNKFVRISGDSPLFDTKLLDKALLIEKKLKSFDLITNIFPRSFPSGQSIEIIKTSIIRKYLYKFNSRDKEHVTTFFYRNNKNFIIRNFVTCNKTKTNNLKLSIDTKKDLYEIKKRINKKNFLNFKLKLNF
ncbi:hypothetical protein N8724_01425 [Candidatus Pelagibacter sp.]|nr:hypothetical protein [Candidatus Pelagibacter sp.]